MKVKTEADCSCGGNFVYFAGPGGSRRVCTVCLNQQTGIDMCVDSRQSDDPPSHRVRVCPKCSDFMCPALRGVGCKLDGLPLEQQELEHAKQFDESDLAELVYDYGTDWVEEHYSCKEHECEIGYSDDPPESEMEICDECGYRGTKPCTFCDLVKGSYLDNILERQQLEDECECCMSTIADAWEFNEHGGKVCAACVAFLEFADGRQIISDGILEQQELEDYENIEYEHFDLSSDNTPFSV